MQCRQAEDRVAGAASVCQASGSPAEDCVCKASPLPRTPISGYPSVSLQAAPPSSAHLAHPFH